MQEMPPPNINIPTPQRSPSLPSSGLSLTSPSSAIPRPQTPSSLYSQNPFDFQVPAIPPRLSRVGRRISEMGMNVLVGPDLPDEPPKPRRDPVVKAGEVPGMGDEPIMCPFCDKPLPPAFILTQMAHHHANSQEKKRTASIVERKSSLSRRPGEVSRSASGSGPVGMGMARVMEGAGTSVAMGATASLPGSARPSLTGDIREPATSTALAATKSASELTTDALLESTRPKAGEVLPKATAESLLPTVKSAETADTAGASSIISPEEVRKWSLSAGIDLGSSSPAPAPAEKAIPALPPPPPPSSTVAERLKKTERSGSGSSSKFGGFFGRGSAKAQDGDSDDEEEGQGTGGYAKLDAPPSPDREEAPSWREKAKAESVESKVAEPESAAKSAVVEETKEKAASDEALRKLLVEVLGKVNTMSKSHEDLLHSHTTLLTSLKIARSNLAMAEANSEMLEEQLKRAPQTAARPGPTPQVSTRPGTPSNGAPTAPLPSRSTGAIPSIVLPPQRKSLDEARPLPIVAPRRSEDGRPARPQSMIMPPPNMYNNGPATGPPLGSSNKESKGMFGFLGGGKTKVPGLGTINIPSAKDLQAQAARFGDSLANPGPSRPGTPSRETGQFFDYHTPAQYAPIENRPQRSASGDYPSRAPSPNPNGNRTVSGQSPSSATSLQSPAAVRPQPIPPAIAAELAKLRTSYTASQTRMEAMNKELTELKKGKVDMEAELESLSQALFEEANKMVSDERKRRAEVEEHLKEVKEEREALRETIKVLGGQADLPSESEVDADDDSKEASGDEGIVPRDLDKHYEALRKTIHHVADGTAPSAAFEVAARGSADDTVPAEGGGRKVSAGMAEANPWAEVDFAAGVPMLPSRQDEDMDPLARAVEPSAGAGAEMERGG